MSENIQQIFSITEYSGRKYDPEILLPVNTRQRFQGNEVKTDLKASIKISQHHSDSNISQQILDV